jgi:hypothetical protein
MKAQTRWLVALSIGLACLGPLHPADADSTPSTQPTGVAATGDLDLTFTDRSPLSKPAELARRLNLKPADVAVDYDLSKCPCKAYVPTNYDPNVPVGLFVYLGYKDTVSTPPLWHSLLDKNHLIFISPVCHFGEQYGPTASLWQMMGLAFDLVHNLQKQYKIDPHRVYLMSWARGSLRTSLASSDVFTGFIVSGDPDYFARLMLPNGRSYSPNFMPPPGELFSRAKSCGFFFIDDGSFQEETLLKIAAMRRDDFANVASAALSFGDDLHFPNLKPDWFEQQALPFLDKASASIPQSPKPGASATPSTAPAAPVDEAEHLLGMAKIYIANGQTDLAREKLQEIVQSYPNDPAAKEANQLLSQLNNQQ